MKTLCTQETFWHGATVDPMPVAECSGFPGRGGAIAIVHKANEFLQSFGTEKALRNESNCAAALTVSTYIHFYSALWQLQYFCARQLRFRPWAVANIRSFNGPAHVHILSLPVPTAVCTPATRLRVWILAQNHEHRTLKLKCSLSAELPVLVIQKLCYAGAPPTF